MVKNGSEREYQVKIKFPSRNVGDAFATTLGAEIEGREDVYHGSSYEGSNIEPRGGLDSPQGKPKFNQDTLLTEGKDGRQASGKKMHME